VLHCDKTLRTFENTRDTARVFYISLAVFSNGLRVLSQCNTRLRLLYLLIKMHWTSWNIFKKHVENFRIFKTERLKGSLAHGYSTQCKHLGKSYGRLENTRLYTRGILYFLYVSPRSRITLHVHLQTHLSQHVTSSR